MSSAFLLSASSRQSNASFLESICVKVWVEIWLKIKSIVVDGFGDRGRNEMVDRQTIVNAFSDGRGRNGAFETVEHLAAERLGE